MVDSTKLKAAVMSYFRFEKGAIVGTEVTYSDISGMADVLACVGDEVIEIETKVDKVDLLTHEVTKRKHEIMKTSIEEYKDKLPNRYYLCVTQNLQKTAEKFIEEYNPAYGLIIFDTRTQKIDSRTVKIVKPAQKLHTHVNDHIKHALVLRLCSELVNLYEKKANGEIPGASSTRKQPHTRVNKKERRPSGRTPIIYSEVEDHDNHRF